MSKQEYDTDVLIVGGGPSGSICAYYLSKAGIKVILIDSEIFPRDKICGDFVSPVGLNELMKIGISELESFNKTSVITGASVYLDGVLQITKSLPTIEGLTNYGRVIPRKTLDNWILEAAKKQGTQIIAPCKLESYSVNNNCVTANCKIEGVEKQLIAKMIVGADGSNSRVARIMRGKKPNPENKIVAVRAYFENTNCTSKNAELFFTSKSFPGYSWFFPISPTMANVGIGMMLENFPKEEVHLNKLLGNMIENDVAFRSKIGNGKAVGKIVGYPLSIYNPRASLVKERVLVTGDAAGLVNPINGEGIQYAMQSGRWAAECIITCLSKNDFSAKSLKIFETKVKSEIGYGMSISNIVMQFIRNKNLNPLWLKLLSIMIVQAKKDEKYANIAGGILSGMLPASSALKIYFIRKSLIRGIIFPFKGTSGIFKFMKDSIVFVYSSFKQAITQRKEYWNWIIDISTSIFSAIKIYFTRQKRTSNSDKFITNKSNTIGKSTNSPKKT